MQDDVMKIRGKDNEPRYKVLGMEVLDVRECQHPDTKPGTVCPVCGLPKPDLNEVNQKPV
jgi:hypothetical protein